MTQGMNRDSRIQAGLRQGILKYGADIAWLDGLRDDTSSVRLEYEVVTGILLPVDAQQKEQLAGNRHTAVFPSLTLIDEKLLSLKTDILPSEAAYLAYPERTVIDGGKQGLVIQAAEMK